MTTSGLQAALDEAGIGPWAYSLDGDMPIEAYVLSHEPDGRRATYYSERGHRQCLRFFEEEAEACQDLYARLIEDPTTRPRPPGKPKPRPPEW